MGKESTNKDEGFETEGTNNPDNFLKKDLILAKTNVKRLTQRMSELEQVTSNVQRSLERETSDHQKDNQRSREFEKDQHKKYNALEAKFHNACDKISELEDKLRLSILKGKQSLEKNFPTEDSSWEIKQIRRSHDNDLEVLRMKDRRLVRELMQVKDTNEKLMETLATRKVRSEAAQKNGDESYYEVLAIETEAMKRAYEIRLGSLQKEVEMARADTLTMEHQLQEQHKSHQAAINARSMLQQFERASS